VQPKPEETEGSQETKGYESTMPDFAILNPEGGRSLPLQPKLAIGSSGEKNTQPKQEEQQIGAPREKKEQEPDRVAAELVPRNHAPAPARGGEGAIGRDEDRKEVSVMMNTEEGTIQRMQQEEQEEEEEEIAREIASLTLTSKDGSAREGETSKKEEEAITREPPRKVTGNKSNYTFYIPNPKKAEERREKQMAKPRQPNIQEDWYTESAKRVKKLAANLADAKIVIIDSARKHMSGVDQTAEIDEAQAVNMIRSGQEVYWSSTDEKFGEIYRISYGKNKKTIVFSTKDDGANVTVFHIGPGAKY
jgi:hypothetical protein